MSPRAPTGWADSDLLVGPTTLRGRVPPLLGVSRQAVEAVSSRSRTLVGRLRTPDAKRGESPLKAGQHAGGPGPGCRPDGGQTARRWRRGR